MRRTRANTPLFVATGSSTTQFPLTRYDASHYRYVYYIADSINAGSSRERSGPLPEDSTHFTDEKSVMKLVFETLIRASVSEVLLQPDVQYSDQPVI